MIDDKNKIPGLQCEVERGPEFRGQRSRVGRREMSECALETGSIWLKVAQGGRVQPLRRRPASSSLITWN